MFKATISGSEMYNVFRSHTITTPHAPALSDDSASLTYAKLREEAESIAKQLISHDIRGSEPVGVVLPAGLNQVICQVAVLAAGGVCFPINPDVPQLRLENLLDRAHLRYFISCRSLAGWEKEALQPLRAGDGDERPNLHKRNKPMAPTEIDHAVTHLLHTSGSTGDPEIVQISEKAILHLASSTEITPLYSSDKTLFINDPSFDLALFEIWVTLISGAEVVAANKEVLLEGSQLEAFIREKHITAAFLSTGHFNSIAFSCPTAFSHLRTLITAGSAASPLAMRMVLKNRPPEQLWNAYGPTEATSFATLYRVDEQEAQNSSIAIGQAIGDMQVFLLQEDGHAPAMGAVGEICISGPGVSPGYVDDPDANRTQFVRLEGKAKCKEAANLYYKTGDLGRIRTGSQNILEYVGRKDRQVKHNGFRVELSEVETIVMKNTQILDAHVLQVESPGDNLRKVLVAFVVPEDSTTFTSQAIQAFCRKYLPAYMVPNLFIPLNKVPLNSRGKTDYKALESEVGKRYLHDRSSSSKKTESPLEETWKSILGIPEVNPEDDFFHLGASSLEAAQLTVKLKEKHGKTVTLQEIYENSRFLDMARYLDSPDSPKKPNRHLATRMRKDARLADSITPQPGSAAEWDTSGSILITGATGFVGTFLLYHILTSTATPSRIVCLVRSVNSSAEIRLRQAFEKYDLWEPEFQRKVQVVDGSFALHEFGLNPEDYKHLAASIDAVFHFGAHVNFCQRYEEHFDDNIIGTMNIIRFAGQGRPKSIHYASTIDAWGATGLVNGTRSLLEDEPLEPHIQGPLYDTGYSQSQWVAEEQIRRARDRGFAVAIYRLGTVICDSKRHAGNPNDFFARVMVGCTKLGRFPLIEDLRWEYVPVDYACQAILHIARLTTNLGRSYSIVSPDPSMSVSLEDTCHLLNEAGFRVEKVPYSEWVESLETSSALDESPLLELMPLIREKVFRDLTRFQTSKNTPVYRTENTRHALGSAGWLSYTPLKSSTIRGMFDFWNAKGAYAI